MWYLHAELHHLGSSARLALGTGRWLELGTMFAARVLKATGLLPATPTCTFPSVSPPLPRLLRVGTVGSTVLMAV